MTEINRTKTKLIIQIPCYNEEDTLLQTVADLPAFLEGIDEIEYLIVNDGSQDDTVETARLAGVHHIVSFPINKGLARAFMAGIDACLHMGADIIVNTDADNQYNGADIEKLVQPILGKEADVVIGERPIDDTRHFSWKKKKFQRLGSWVVRLASGTDVPDAPSGFRAYSREAALRLNVINNYTYTLETIIQAGMSKTAITSVPIRTNPEARESRLFKSMWGYVRRSASIIVRSFIMYRPLKFLGTIGVVLFVIGFMISLRFAILLLMGDAGMHIQSLILSSLLMMLGVIVFVCGIIADTVSVNRKILEDIQYRIKKLETGKNYNNTNSGGPSAKTSSSSISHPSSTPTGTTSVPL